MKDINAVDTSEDDLRLATYVGDTSDEILVAYRDGVVEELSPFKAADWSAELLAVDGSLEYEYYSEVFEDAPVVEQRPLSAAAFATLTGRYVAAHVLSAAGGIAALVVASMVFGLNGIAVALPMIVVLVCAAYYRVGAGLRDTTQAQHAWKPALAGLVLPSVFAAVSGIGLAVGVALLFPFAAHVGANEF